MILIRNPQLCPFLFRWNSFMPMQLPRSTDNSVIKMLSGMLLNRILIKTLYCCRFIRAKPFSISLIQLYHSWDSQSIAHIESYLKLAHNSSVIQMVRSCKSCRIVESFFIFAYPHLFVNKMNLHGNIGKRIHQNGLSFYD